MYRSTSITFLVLALLPSTVFSQSSDDGYETLYRDQLPIVRSKEFGMADDPDSELFDYPIFCLRCQGEFCQRNYVEAVRISALATATRLRSHSILHRRPSHSSANDISIVLGNNSSMVSRWSEVSRIQSHWIGKDTIKRAICTDGTIAEQLGYKLGYYRLTCKRLAWNLRADAEDTQEKILKEILRIRRLTGRRQTGANDQQREAVCDNGYYIWGMACVDSSCDYFKIICIRVLVRRNSQDGKEPMEKTDTRVCNRRVCCPLSCGTCGGRDCAGSQGGRKNCCESDIRLFGSVCNGPDDAPCVLSPDDLIFTSIPNPYLQKCNGRVCCGEGCDQCGGLGCGYYDGGADNCCTSNILEAGKICGGPKDFPCIMSS